MMEPADRRSSRRRARVQRPVHQARLRGPRTPRRGPARRDRGRRPRGLPKSTAARLLATLVGEGAVEQVPGETSYRLGPRLVTLGGGFSLVRSLAAIARPILAELAAASGEAAGLAVPDGDLVHYIDQVDTPNPVVVRDWTGARAHRSMRSRRAGAAGVPDAGRDRALSGAGRWSGSRRTLADADAVRERLREVRRRRATPGRSRSSTPGSRRWPRRSPTRRVRSSPRSTSTDRRTASRPRGGKRSSARLVVTGAARIAAGLRER